MSTCVKFDCRHFAYDEPLSQCLTMIAALSRRCGSLGSMAGASVPCKRCDKTRSNGENFGSTCIIGPVNTSEGKEIFISTQGSDAFDRLCKGHALATLREAVSLAYACGTYVRWTLRIPQAVTEFASATNRGVYTSFMQSYNFGAIAQNG